MIGHYTPAIVTALRQGYGRADLVADVLAGLLVGVVALPLSLALAIASGAPPQVGLWTAIIGGFLIALCGGSRVQVGGPAGAFVGLCAAIVNQFGLAGLALATAMSGGLLLFLGVFRLGVVISFIPIPVVIGFTTGIAVILASTQLGPALGISDPVHPVEHLHHRVLHLWHGLSTAHVLPAAICAGTIAVIIALRRWNAKLPGGLIAIVAAAALVWACGWEGAGHGEVATIATRYPEFAQGLPLFSWPSLDWFRPDARYLDQLAAHGQTFDVIRYVTDLSQFALALGLLGAIESLLSAVVADGMTGHRHDSNSELIGQGVANLLAPFFGCLPATGVIARTSANVRAGARTPVAGIVHALTVLVILVVLAPLVIHVPLAALAGVLLVVCWYMAELRHWPHILRAGRSDAALLPIAFGLTAFVGLTMAILVGVVLAMFFFVKRIGDHMQIERVAREHSGEIPSGVPAGVEVYEVRGPFFFGAATMLRDLDGGLERGTRALVLRLRHVPFIDATAAFALRELSASCKRRGIRLVIAEIHSRPLIDFGRLGLDVAIGEDCIHGSLASALACAADAPAPVTATRRRSQT